MLPEDAFDHDSEFGLYVFSQCPINCYVLAYGVGEFSGYGSECLVSEDFDGTVVYL